MAKACELRLQRHTVPSIAKELEVGTSTVERWLKAEGIKVGQVKRASKAS